VSNLIHLPTDKTTIFIGDTHGDIETTKQIIEIYPPDNNRLIFLGDYIDRGVYPRENIDYLLNLRDRNKDDVILLMGNHEAHPVVDCNSNFFKQLNEEEIKKRFLSARMDSALILFAERFTYGINIVLVLALIGLSLGIIGLFASEVYALFGNLNNFEQNVLTALGTLLIIWVMIELMSTEIKYLKNYQSWVMHTNGN